MNWYQIKATDCIKVLGIIAILAASTSASQAKKAMTITERQDSLMKTVAKAEKSGDLTLKEANSFRDSEMKIEAKESKMRSNNGGKLTYKNIAEIEYDLNKMSNKLHKQQLGKRLLK